MLHAFSDSSSGHSSAAHLLRQARDDLESAAGYARGLVADMNWQSDAVRHVHDDIAEIQSRLARLADAADRSLADVLADRRRYENALALMGP